MYKDPYRITAKLYDRFVEPLNVQVRQIALRMYPPQAGMQVLDVGCGTGTNLDLYRRNQCQVSGIDLSPAMIQEARKKLGSGADIRLGDASHMLFPDASFDLVTSMLTLHEMPGEIRSLVMEEMWRVLKPSGRLLLIDFHPGPIRFPKGWLMKCLILIFEMAAGREHYNHYRNFIKNGGLPRLMKEDRQKIEKKKILSKGNLAIFLLRAESLPSVYQELRYQFASTTHSSIRLP
jgi:ubiquinone/menaquinone biosynthesis C-methylase UbiE